MIFVARQFQEKCREQHKDLHITFVDLTKRLEPRTPFESPGKIEMSINIPCSASLMIVPAYPKLAPSFTKDLTNNHNPLTPQIRTRVHLHRSADSY